MSSRSLLCVLGLVFAAQSINTARAEPPKAKDGPLGMKFVPLPKGTFYIVYRKEGS